MSRLEGLFGAASEAPRAADRRTRALVLLGVALAAFGIVASSVPGVLVTLAAWWSAERDLDRVESGWLPTSARPRVDAARTYALTGLGLAAALMMAQAWILAQGVYGPLWLDWLSRIVG